MPRRSGRPFSSMGRRRASPSAKPTLPAKTTSAVPATIPPQAKQPGLMANMASTAAGVAVGSAVGHTLGHALTGSFGGSSVDPQQDVTNSTENGNKPCAYELKQFLECANHNADLSLCQGFSEALKNCNTGMGVDILLSAAASAARAAIADENLSSTNHTLFIPTNNNSGSSSTIHYRHQVNPSSVAASDTSNFITSQTQLINGYIKNNLELLLKNQQFFTEPQQLLLLGGGDESSQTLSHSQQLSILAAGLSSNYYSSSSALSSAYSNIYNHDFFLSRKQPLESHVLLQKHYKEGDEGAFKGSNRRGLDDSAAGGGDSGNVNISTETSVLKQYLFNEMLLNQQNAAHSRRPLPYPTNDGAGNYYCGEQVNGDMDPFKNYSGQTREVKPSFDDMNNNHQSNSITKRHSSKSHNLICLPNNNKSTNDDGEIKFFIPHPPPSSSSSNYPLIKDDKINDVVIAPPPKKILFELMKGDDFRKERMPEEIETTIYNSLFPSFPSSSYDKETEAGVNFLDHKHEFQEFMYNLLLKKHGLPIPPTSFSTTNNNNNEQQQQPSPFFLNINNNCNNKADDKVILPNSNYYSLLPKNNDNSLSYSLEHLNEKEVVEDKRSRRRPRGVKRKFKSSSDDAALPNAKSADIHINVSSAENESYRGDDVRDYKFNADSLQLTVIEGHAIACFDVGGEKRLCLPQVLNIVLKDFPLTQINKACDALHIYCSRCKDVQLKALKQAGIISFVVPDCGLITKTDTERLCDHLLRVCRTTITGTTTKTCRRRGRLNQSNSLTINISPFVEPDDDDDYSLESKNSTTVTNLTVTTTKAGKKTAIYDFTDNIVEDPHHHPQSAAARATKSRRRSDILIPHPSSTDVDDEDGRHFTVYHECFGRCYGKVLPELYLTHDSPCIKCSECQILLKPQQFVCHSHGPAQQRVCHWGFDSEEWRSYIFPIYRAAGVAVAPPSSSADKRINHSTTTVNGDDDEDDDPFVGHMQFFQPLNNGKRKRRGQNNFVVETTADILPYDSESELSSTNEVDECRRHQDESIKQMIDLKFENFRWKHSNRQDVPGSINVSSTNNIKNEDRDEASQNLATSSLIDPCLETKAIQSQTPVRITPACFHSFTAADFRPQRIKKSSQSPPPPLSPLQQRVLLITPDSGHTTKSNNPPPYDTSSNNKSNPALNSPYRADFSALTTPPAVMVKGGIDTISSSDYNFSGNSFYPSFRTNNFSQINNDDVIIITSSHNNNNDDNINNNCNNTIPSYYACDTAFSSYLSQTPITPTLVTHHTHTPSYPPFMTLESGYAGPRCSIETPAAAVGAFKILQHYQPSLSGGSYNYNNPPMEWPMPNFAAFLPPQNHMFYYPPGPPFLPPSFLFPNSTPQPSPFFYFVPPPMPKIDLTVLENEPIGKSERVSMYPVSDFSPFTPAARSSSSASSNKIPPPEQKLISSRLNTNSPSVEATKYTPGIVYLERSLSMDDLLLLEESTKRLNFPDYCSTDLPVATSEIGFSDRIQKTNKSKNTAIKPIKQQDPRFSSIRHQTTFTTNYPLSKVAVVLQPKGSPPSQTKFPNSDPATPTASAIITTTNTTTTTTNKVTPGAAEYVTPKDMSFLNNRISLLLNDLRFQIKSRFLTHLSSSSLTLTNSYSRADKLENGVVPADSVAAAAMLDQIDVLFGHVASTIRSNVVDTFKDRLLFPQRKFRFKRNHNHLGGSYSGHSVSVTTDATKSFSPSSSSTTPPTRRPPL